MKLALLLGGVSVTGGAISFLAPIGVLDILGGLMGLSGLVGAAFVLLRQLRSST